MGYSTDFFGKFELNRKMDEELANYINKFNISRRVKRDVEKIKEVYPDWEMNSNKGDLGRDGEFFVGGYNMYSGLNRGEDDSILDFNVPPKGQLGLWCQWRVSDDRLSIEWDEGEKFYSYCEWLQYIIDNFLKPNGYSIDGEVEFQGEDYSDHGVIDIVENDRVRIRYYRYILEDDGYIYGGSDEAEVPQF